MWEHLVEFAHQTDGVTIIPGAVPEMINNPNIMVKKFQDPAKFEMLIGHKVIDQEDELLSKVEDYIFQYIEKKSYLKPLNI